MQSKRGHAIAHNHKGYENLRAGRHRETRNKRAQVTIFIIIAIVIVAAVIGYVLFRGILGSSNIPASLEPAYLKLQSCLQDEGSIGIDVLESQGGYIKPENFELGNQYMPFSSQLNFLGNPIPYWYYVSGNNIQKEQVPLLSGIESQLGDFVNSEIGECNFDFLREQGFVIEFNPKSVEVDIQDKKVTMNLLMDLVITKGEDSASLSNVQVDVNSKLGKLYKSAKIVYQYEQENLFLENYAVDILRLNAPVDGVELGCSPKVWNAEDVFNDIEDSIESNVAAIKSDSGDYELQTKEDKYFVVDFSIDEQVRFLNSKNWPHTIEVSPSSGPIMMSEPVGNQEGLGILGFCYVPYHYIYDVKYPVLIQIEDGDEIFQFPVAVVIQGNKPREPISGASASSFDIPDLCESAITPMSVNIYDNYLNSVDADVSFKCAGTSCQLGKINSSRSIVNFPQCANGKIVVNADGFREKSETITTTHSDDINIILDRIYSVYVDTKIDGKSFSGDGQVIVNFVSNDSSATLVYPGQNQVSLSEGQYEITAYVYKNSSLKLEETTYQQCVEISQGGIGGIFGLTQDKCFDVAIPAQIISNALAAGGKQNHYFSESELMNSINLELNLKGLQVPNTLEKLQENYGLADNNGIGVSFR